MLWFSCLTKPLPWANGSSRPHSIISSAPARVAGIHRGIGTWRGAPVPGLTHFAVVAGRLPADFRGNDVTQYSPAG